MTAGAQRAMLEALAAGGPSPDRADRLGLFGQFVGSWDVEVETASADGGWSRATAEWHFGWILEGRAVLDVWICEPIDYGVSIRLYEAARDRWRSVWVGPKLGVLRTFDVEARPDEIVLRGTDDSGRPMWWVFSEVTPESFRWRAQVFDAREWRIVQRMWSRRRPGKPRGSAEPLQADPVRGRA
ncbi:MAG TPA: hypothetical protein VFS11_06910 [Gemmatimonadales bacterium]|nr:hypothetical protein [Gemmatimonadales bacterium]